MHIYFLGIGGTGVGPLAMIAKEAGFEVSGSDFNDSEYTRGLIKKGIDVEVLDPQLEDMERAHNQSPIDWVVSVSSILRQNPNHPAFEFARQNNIRITERDECLNEILKRKNLKMLAAAGTHGKTTTSAMFVWVMQKLGIPESYSVGAKMDFAAMGHFDEKSEYFVYECDEFHRNFLHFYPFLSVISGIAWDHHEVFPSQEDYNQAFRDFISQSETTILWAEDATKLQIVESDSCSILDDNDALTSKITLHGLYNRRNARLVVEAIHRITGRDREALVEIISSFPGTSRRMEELTENLFSDYAHTPEKIHGCLSVASELAAERGKRVVVVYEPLTNRRQHFMKELYKDSFLEADHVYWVPSYLAREDPNQVVLTPEDLISFLASPEKATPANLDDTLWSNINSEIKAGAIVVCMSGGGGKSLDEWLRAKIREQHP